MSAKTQNPWTTHWLVRTLAALMGFFLLVFGGLLLVVWVTQGANNPAAPNVGMGVQIIVTVIFGVVALFGAVLLWFGLKRPKGSVEVALPAAEPSPAEGYSEARVSSPPSLPMPQASPEPLLGATAVLEEVRVARPPLGHPHERRVTDPELGELIAACGPERNGQTHYFVWAGLCVLLALFCTAFPTGLIEVPAAKPEDAKIVNFIFWGGAGLSLLFALGMVWGPVLGAPQVIELYERGIVERLGEQVRRIELSAIQHLQVREFYAHRFAPRTFNVKAQVQGQKQLAFSSELRGQGEHIIECLASCIPQTEFIEWDTTL